MWTDDEDAALRVLVAEHGTKKWALVASKLADKGGKQCRRRGQLSAHVTGHFGCCVLGVLCCVVPPRSRYVRVITCSAPIGFF